MIAEPKLVAIVENQWTVIIDQLKMYLISFQFYESQSWGSFHWEFDQFNKK